MPTLIILPSNTGSSEPVLINTGSTGISITLESFVTASSDYNLAGQQNTLSAKYEAVIAGIGHTSIATINTPNLGTKIVDADTRFVARGMKTIGTPNLVSSYVVPTTVTEVVL